MACLTDAAREREAEDELVPQIGGVSPDVKDSPLEGGHPLVKSTRGLLILGQDDVGSPFCSCPLL